MDDPRLSELLEEALDCGLTPEEVCTQCPELVPEIRRRWEKCLALESELLACFPPRGPAWVNGSSGQGGVTAGLPALPGYQLLSVLGRGGMGIVYKGRHLALNRIVAIKMLLSGRFAGGTERVRFKREAMALAMLRHQHIVQVHDVGEFEDRPYFTMELIEGGTLSECLANVPQPAGKAAEVLGALANAVECAHQGGIVHRDLKPSNVLMTADGMPKISDFGLAREVAGADLITLSGARVGTPSYMAPEQASGRWGDVGPSADVYALGAILYEMLTGRPPFRGETAADTERQVINNEPALPSQLNARVPRDLETICLKCLEKTPDRRYASAAALAADLQCFQRGEPVAARRIGRLERGAKWVRRRPAVAALWAVGTVVAIALGGGSLIWLSDRAAAERDIAADLREARTHERASLWARANDALNRASLRLGDRRLEPIRTQLDQAKRAAALVPQLEMIRKNRSATIGHSAYGEDGFVQTDRAYAALFRDAGFGDEGADAAVCANRIAASDVRPALVAALYEWMRCAREERRFQWLKAVVRGADPDPSGWRDKALDPATWQNAGASAELVSDKSLAGRPAELLVFVYERLNIAGRDALPFLIRVQQSHPDDFWVNLNLSVAMRTALRYDDAVRYTQAAVVLRPDSAIAHNYLGNALQAQAKGLMKESPADALAKRWTELVMEQAIGEQRESLRLDPGSAYAHFNLAYCLALVGRHSEAAPEFEICLRGLPDNIAAHRQPGMETFHVLDRFDHQARIRLEFGDTLEALGRFNAAAEQYKLAIAREPANALSQSKLADVLARLGDWKESFIHWQASLEPPLETGARLWSGYAEHCLFAGETELYARACVELLRRFETSDDPRDWENVARACLLGPQPEEVLRRAAALIDRVLEGDRAKPTGFRSYFLASKGLSEYRMGRAAAAIAIMEGDASGVLSPTPELVVAMAQSSLGHSLAARQSLAHAVLSYDWSPDNADSSESWMHHCLRREAERLILPNFEQLVDASVGPADNQERLAILGACQFRKLNGRAARLWAEAIEASPDLADAHLVDAARAAALAGAGVGMEAEKFTSTERAGWRALAIRFLMEKLARIEKGTDPGHPPANDIQETLATWQITPDFAAIRDVGATSRLSEAEQNACKLLWSRVASVLASPAGKK